jgi:hypothetical protein
MKTVSTDRRRLVIAAALGIALLGRCSFASEALDSKPKDYGLLFGTAYGLDDRPLYGVRVTIHPVGKRHPVWNLLSDHRGEFAQRVPPGPGDYLVTGEAEITTVENGKAQKKKRLRGEATVHLDGQERRDFSLHLKE